MNAVPGPPFSQSGVPRPQRALFPRDRTYPGRKDSFIHGNATNESEFGQDNCLTRNTGGLLQN